MGGNAFAHAASGTLPLLHTPRMSSEKYQQLKKIYEYKLRQCLSTQKVSILKEAPEKTSYGDLDFIVESAVDSIDWHHVAEQLGAIGLITHSSGKVQSCSLAVPMDGSASASYSIYEHKYNAADLSKEMTVEEYAQIDLEVVPKELFDWHSFYSSYGDMCGMLGHMVHNHGFTISDRGLFLRLAALDTAKEMKLGNIPEKSGKLFLSKDPGKVLQFLGLSYHVYQQGFSTAEELYQWLCQCRLLSKSSVKVKKDDASGRQKERKRPLYSTFFNDWLPTYFEAGTNHTVEAEAQSDQSTRTSQRQDLASEAVAFFDRKEEYEEMNAALIRQIQSRTVDLQIKPLIAQHSGFKNEKLAEIVRGFRRWVGFEDGSPYILSASHDDEQSQLYKFLDEQDTTRLGDEARVSQWVKENWEVIKGLERERGKNLRLPA